MDRHTVITLLILILVAALVGIALLFPVNTGCTWWGR